MSVKEKVKEHSIEVISFTGSNIQSDLTELYEANHKNIHDMEEAGCDPKYTVKVDGVEVLRVDVNQLLAISWAAQKLIDAEIDYIRSLE